MKEQGRMAKESFRDLLGWYVAIAWTLLFYLLFSYLYMTSPPKELPVVDGLIIPVDFKQRLHFHGLDKEISVIEINRGNLYFYRDGKKCTF